MTDSDYQTTLDDVRESLHRIEAKLTPVRCCSAPGCKTLTAHRFCAKHAPRAGWAIAEATHDELRT